MIYTTGGFISKKICLRKNYEIILRIKLMLYATGGFIIKKISSLKKSL